MEDSYNDLLFSATVSGGSLGGPQSVDTTNGVIRWSPPNDGAGAYTFDVTVTDTDSMTDSTSFSLTVDDYNESPPDFTNIIPNGIQKSSTHPGEPASGNEYHTNILAGSDSQTPNENLQVTALDPLPPGMTLATNGDLDWVVPEGVGGGSWRVRIKLEDDGAVNGAPRGTILVYNFTTVESWSVPTNPSGADIFWKDNYAALEESYGISVNGSLVDEPIPGIGTIGGNFSFTESYQNTEPLHADSFDFTTEDFTVTLSASFSYTPEVNGEGLDSFQYSGRKQSHRWAEQDVSPVEDPPGTCDHSEFGEFCNELVNDAQSNDATVTIEVGKAVRADIDIDLPEFNPDAAQTRSAWHTYDPAADAGDDDLAIVKINDDDDNENNQEDRFELSDSGEHGENQELVKARLGYWLRDDAEIDDFTAKLQASTLADTLFRIWETEKKEKEIIPFTSLHSGTEFKLADLPEEVWLEGLDKGLASLTLDIHGLNSALFTDMALPNGGAIASTNDSDTVQIGVGIGLTAYRPMHPPGGYAPFQKTAVAEADETDTKLGPGIRINGDDDDGGGVADRYESFTNTQENDLIEVLIESIPGQNNLVLEVTHSGLFVWENWSKGGAPIATSSGPSAPLTFDSNGQKTVYVEWTDAAHGTGDVKLVNNSTSQVIDTLTFHTFKSIAIGLSGEQFSESSGSGQNVTNTGIYDIMVEMYESGYDAYFFNEDDVYGFPSNMVGFGPVYDEIAAAIGHRDFGVIPGLEPGRFVTDIGLIGHSHGGGSIYDLVWRLNLMSSTLNPYNIAFTGYVDAIKQASINAETRLPLGTAFHANYYQRNGPIDGWIVEGAHINVDVNADRGWKDEDGDDLTHTTIDDSGVEEDDDGLFDEVVPIFKNNLLQ